MSLPTTIQLRARLGRTWAMLMTTATLFAQPAPEPAPPAVDGPALLNKWTPAVIPESLRKQKIEAEVSVRFVVDETGRVSTARVLRSDNPKLDDAALAAVRAWEFKPALDGGRPAACCLEVAVEFSASRTARKVKPGMLPEAGFLPALAPRTAAQPLATPPGEYPAALTARKLPGRVQFASVISSEGRVVTPRILGASHADFVVPALESLHNWNFTPAMQGDLAVKATIEGEVTFNEIGASREEMLAANGITGPDGAVPPVCPEPLFAVDAVWPIEPLLAGEGGVAEVEFTVSATGRVRDATVRSASRPEFGRAAVAALEMWLFQPALSGGQLISVPLLKRTEFHVPPDEPTARLIEARRAGKISSARGLDNKLEPLWRVPPVYPRTLRESRPAGAAEIELVIDRDGRVRLTEIISATQEEFGWAAATAVGQWVFRPPMRGGQPVEVKVRVPMSFAAPEE